MFTQEVAKLNGEQLQVYNAAGHCVVLAGPGSGKTRSLTLKLARMLQEDVRQPRGIACITYSNECVREIERRLQKLGVPRDRRLFIGTVHSFCLNNIVRPYAKLAGFALPEPMKVASEDQQTDCFQKVVNRCQINHSRVDMDRHRRTCLDRNSEDWQANGLGRLIEAYEAELRSARLVDFDDMALMGLKIVEENVWARRLLKARYPILVVDEYQDLGLPLHRLVEVLCFNAGIRLLAVGDPDQSIYGFAGAKPDLLLSLAKRKDVHTVRLHMNYRCGQEIARAARQVLGQDAEIVVPDDTPPGTIYFQEISTGLEAQAREICEKIVPTLINEGYDYGDIAVLYLDKNDGDIIANAARQAALKFIRIDGNAPYPKTRLTRWIEDCAVWCVDGWRKGDPRLSDLLRRWSEFTGAVPDVLSEDRRGLVKFLWDHRSKAVHASISLQSWLFSFSDQCLHSVFFDGCEQSDEFAALKKLQQACNYQGPLGNLSLEDFSGQRGARDHLNLITLHQAKGREFEAVIMMGLEQGRIPDWRSNSAEKKAENRRLFYVGITRGKKKVFLLYSGWYQISGGRTFKHGPSEFLVKLQSSFATGEPI